MQYAWKNQEINRYVVGKLPVKRSLGDLSTDHITSKQILGK